ncbi:hypothetical protein [Actinomadura flavalba]|uniref:hypothetical protein n=1 Tax=Actinomadura flavalba TaxID=1120938 RepID=UPI00036C56E4|nr:hypothetical protein [Actinomadura flavalba]
MAPSHLTGAVVAVLTLAGCSAGTPAAGAPATIEQLAARTGCSLNGSRGAEELRQGSCSTSRGRYTLVGFTTDQGQAAWLREAKPWGGTYLVGTRWVAVGTPAVLEGLRADLGGRIDHGDRHHGG